VHFDNQPVGAGGHCRASHRCHHVATPGTMTGVGHDRQMAEFLDDRDRRDVKRVARGRLERPDSALAQDYVVVAAGQDVLG
jgi:hypothetical protein